MFREFKQVKQNSQDVPRRYFGNGELELFVWYKKDQEITGFQLCFYHKGHEMALTWHPGKKASVRRIDTGSRGPFVAGSPLLKEKLDCPAQGLLDSFAQDSESLEPELADLVQSVLVEYSSMTL
ncbi:hypothetical protein [Rubellicoccus peritrichatus]|uniref:Uncharacterized protein n=1 Tax=Rubellicoccus peritrichatus TaxID=3080537 RepID=A0AAQ3QWZ8_9BACT|nr:hypothetical protein [Puniceicoccus sp. CR14]WOO42467.1 hypothetical protein RZN69_05150 [Puniceicoccus sp. CR14]